MKSNKRISKILILTTSLMVLISMISIVFAAYTFTKKVTNDIEVGQVKVDSKHFIDYSSSSNSKMRVDTLIDVEDVILNTTTTYSLATDTVFQASKTYYVAGTYSKAIVTVGGTIPSNTYYEDKNGGYYLTSDTTFDSSTSYYTKDSNSGYTATSTVSVGSTIPASTYYVATSTHSGVISIGTVANPAGDEITYEISSTNSKIVTFSKNSVELITVTITSFSEDGIDEASTDNDDCFVVVDTDGLGFVVIDKTLSAGTTDSSETITCSATEKKQDDSNIYLNQLGFAFTFTNEIAVYVRIHIKDAWILTRKYASAQKETYTIKDQIAGNSPFAISDTGWYYNTNENTAYLKTMILPTRDSNGDFASQSYSFNVNQAYFYSNSKTSVYTEYVDVEVSFTVELVQANRALELWGVDPSTLGSI